jgi:glucosamine--fructose-6-phosphate aminotransferase (isomerizing)
METCYIVAERFSQADILHGPIAMVDRSFPAFVFAPPGVTWPGIRELLDKLGKIQAETMVVTDRSNREAPKGAVVIPPRWAQAGARPPLRCRRICSPPSLTSFPPRFFAASLARVKGLNPDQPRGLSKITQTV